MLELTMWFWLASTAGLLSAIDKVLNRQALRGRGGVLAYSTIYFGLTSLFSAIFSFPLTIDWSLGLAGLILLQGLIWSVSSFTMFKAHTQVDVATSSIMARTRVIWMIPFSFLLLGENSSWPELLGIVMIFLGLVILFDKKMAKLNWGVWLVLISSVMAAAGTVINVILVRNYLPAIQVTMVNMIAQALGQGLLLILRNGHKFSAQLLIAFKSNAKILVIAGAIETLAIFLSVRATQVGPPAAATGIYMAMSVSVVWFGYWWLQEKEQLIRKIISSLVVTGGIVIIKYPELTNDLGKRFVQFLPGF